MLLLTHCKKNHPKLCGSPSISPVASSGNPLIERMSFSCSLSKFVPSMSHGSPITGTVVISWGLVRRITVLKYITWTTFVNPCKYILSWYVPCTNYICARYCVNYLCTAWIKYSTSMHSNVCSCSKGSVVLHWKEDGWLHVTVLNNVVWISGSLLKRA